MKLNHILISGIPNACRWLTCVILLLSFISISQVKPTQTIEPKSGKLINIRHAKRLVYDSSIGVDARRLIGDVECEHDGAVMRCDSAYLYSDKKLEAFGHISIIKGDSIFVYGDSLRYDAATKLANLKGHVKCIEKDMTLTTNTLIYDIGNAVASYYNGGTIVNKENTLISKNGHYYSSTKEMAFHYDVILTNPDLKMNGDTLRYNTDNKTAYFIGPSIITSKENYIYCENGWYDTENDISRFSKNAKIVNDNQVLLGDSVYYNRKRGYARATKNVRIIDTTAANQVLITGNYAEHYEKGNKAIVTGNAVFSKVVEKDTLFMAADTLSYSQPDSLHTFVRAFRHVKIYKKDLQGMCDSLTYYMHDSLMTMYNSPILWTNNGQVTSKLIKVTVGQTSIKYFELVNNAIVIQKVDSLDDHKFNQIEGRRIEGFFAKDSIRKLNVIGNAQIIYYVKQKTNYKGVNQTICSDLTVWFNSDGVDRATFRNKPESTVFPLENIKDEEMRLKHFVWFENKRPKKKSDILLR
ncbi:MAG: OstA-like protein [Bacteroidota bacterium]